MMKNPTIEAATRSAILAKMSAAIKDENQEDFAAAYGELADAISASVLEAAREFVESNDSAVLEQRGIRQLTSKETEYWNAVIGAMKSADPRASITTIPQIMPTTIIDEIFKYLVDNHPLLGAIDIQTVTAITRIISASTSGSAVWGATNASMVTTETVNPELSASFSYLDLSVNKLFATMPVSKDILDLGPSYIHTLAVTALSESIAVKLEAAFVDGDGKNKPLGMTRALTGATDGVYPRKTAVAITALDTATYGTLLNTLTQAPNSKRRAVSEVLLVVNPTDYFTKIFPASTPRATDGTFNYGVFPFPTMVVQSEAVPSGYAVFGIAPEYFGGVTTGFDGGRIAYSDEYKLYEDVRAYYVKLYGNGRPKDANAFLYLDISGLAPYVQRVYVTNDPMNITGSITELADARVAALAIGDAALSPTFNKSVMVYTATTSTATGKITVTPMDGEATVEILNGETPVANGANATWSSGKNTLTINVSSMSQTETYTVAVTYTPEG